MNFSIIVNSCDKYSDLWESHFALLREYWQGELPPTYLVTDQITDKCFAGVEILVFNGDVPARLLQACKMIESNRVLITLDDYFVIGNIYGETINYLVNYTVENKIDYLRIYDRRYTKAKHYQDVKIMKKLDLDEKYAISLYPAIWDKSFFEYCAENDGNVWGFEPGLTEKAKLYNANCYSNNSGSFPILDVVRKGGVLRKANRYLKKHNINIGDRKLVNIKIEIRQVLADFIWWHMPRWVYRVARSACEKIGMKFYSEK